MCLIATSRKEDETRFRQRTSFNQICFYTESQSKAHGFEGSVRGVLGNGRREWSDVVGRLGQKREWGTGAGFLSCPGYLRRRQLPLRESARSTRKDRPHWADYQPIRRLTSAVGLPVSTIAAIGHAQCGSPLLDTGVNSTFCAR